MGRRFDPDRAHKPFALIYSENGFGSLALQVSPSFSNRWSSDHLNDQSLGKL